MTDILVSVDNGASTPSDEVFVQLCSDEDPLFRNVVDEVVVRTKVKVSVSGTAELPVEDSKHYVYSPKIDLIVGGIQPLLVNDSELTIDSYTRNLVKIVYLEVDDVNVDFDSDNIEGLQTFHHIQVTTLNAAIEEVDVEKIQVSSVNASIEEIPKPQLITSSINSNIEELHVPRVNVSAHHANIEELHVPRICVSELYVQFECVPGAVLKVDNSQIKIDSTVALSEVKLEVEISSLNINSDKIKLEYIGNTRGYIWLF